MFDDRFQDSGPTLRLVSAARRERPKRIFKAALGKGEGPDHEATRKLVQGYFEGTPEEEKQPLRYSLLTALVLCLIVFYVVWPSFMRHLDIEKRDDKVYIPGGGATSLKALVRKQEQKPIIKQELIPQFYPDFKEVTLISDEDMQVEVDEWSDLEIDGSVGTADLGYGDGGIGGPILSAGVGDVPEPILIFRVEPDYPDAARRARVDGFVLLEAIVNKRGDVVNVKVLQSPPSRYGFSEKATEAVEKWKFKPAIYRGRPINVRIRFSVEFNLHY